MNQPPQKFRVKTDDHILVRTQPPPLRGKEKSNPDLIYYRYIHPKNGRKFDTVIPMTLKQLNQLESFDSLEIIE